MDNKLIYVDNNGEHEVDIENFIKDKSFNEIMKIIGRDEESLLNLKEYKRFKNDYAMYKLLEYFYIKYNDLIKNTKTKVETTNKTTELNEKTVGHNDFVNLDNIGSFAEYMKM